MHPADDVPVLRLGLAGFDGRERGELLDLLTQRRSGPSWRLGAFAQADAWLLNGARLQVQGPTRLQVEPGLPRERSVALDLEDVCRPLAFALPLPEQLRALCHWDPLAPGTFEAVLQRLQQWLAPVLVAWWLGREIVRRGPRLARGVVRVRAAGKLLALLDLRSGLASVAPLLPPAALEGATWDDAPAGATTAPPGFQPTTVAQLAWTYVQRSDEARLPPAYLVQEVAYRRAPQVPLAWLTGSQLMLLHELAAQSGTVDGLGHRTGLARAQVVHDLTCLYHAGALASRPAQATHGASAAAACSLLPATADVLGQAMAAPLAEPSPPSQWEAGWPGAAYASVQAGLPPR